MRALIALAFAWIALLAPAFAAGKLALVVGNDAYQNVAPLEKAVADARAYAALLRDKGFAVDEGYDLDFRRLNAKIAAFVGKIQPGDTAVFVYSGHGWSDGTQNYLVSVDAPASASEEELSGETTPIRNGANGVLDRMERKGAQLRVAIIDACRDNPFAPPGGRGFSQARGLAPMPPPPAGTFVAFSASAGQVALDRLSEGDADPNSVFTREFLPLLRADMSLQDAVKASQTRVVALSRSAGGEQKPAYWDEVVGPACLAECRTPGLDLSALSPAQLCALVAAPDHDAWDARPALSAFVEEAKRRGMAPSDCKPAPAAPERSDSELCERALNADRTDWDAEPAWAADAHEAQRRGLDVAQCRTALHLPPLTVAGAPSGDLSDLPADVLCRDALDAGMTGWDGRPAFAAKRAEAQRRGLDVAACRAALEPRAPAAASEGELAGLPTDVLCADALDVTRTGWDARPAFAAKKAEALKRRLGVTDCRRALGLVRVDADPGVKVRAAMLVAKAEDIQNPAVSVGSAVWSQVAAPTNEPRDVGLRVDVDVPDLKMRASIVLRKNFDASLLSTHWIDLTLQFDPESPVKGVKDVGLPQMRRAKEVEALRGVRAHVNEDHYLIGLNRSDEDKARNLAALKTGVWFDFPLLLSDGRIAKLTIEKAEIGEQILAQAMTAWQ